MNRRTLSWCAIALLALVSVAGALWTLYGKYDFSLKQASLQSQIDSKLPHQTPKGVKVTAAQMQLQNGKITIHVTATVDKLKHPIEAKAHVPGVLKYDPKSASFFFEPDRLVLDEVFVDGVKLPYAVIETSQRGLDAVVLAAAKQLMERSPVYTLPKDVKGNAARMVIEDVEVLDGQIVAHLSFWRLDHVVFFFATLLVVAGILALFLGLNPDIGRPKLKTSAK